MYAVIVTRRQVSGHKRAVTEQIRHQIVSCQQGFHAVVVAFGLQDFVFFNLAELADHAVSRHHQHVGIGIQRANFITQWAHEKIVKGAIAGSIRLLRFFHIDLVVFNEQIDNQLR
ncbi:hypothetical protein D3C80_1636740 [compost metagenome]